MAGRGVLGSFGDFYDGLMGIAVAGLGYLLIDKALLRTNAGFLDDSSFGAADELLVVWFVWNLTYHVGSTGVCGR